MAVLFARGLELAKASRRQAIAAISSVEFSFGVDTCRSFSRWVTMRPVDTLLRCSSQPPTVRADLVRTLIVNCHAVRPQCLEVYGGLVVIHGLRGVATRQKLVEDVLRKGSPSGT